MARRCSICDHPKRDIIDQALVSNAVLRGITREYGVSEDALTRHKKSHIPELLSRAQEIQDNKAVMVAEVARAKEAMETGQANNLLQQVKDLINRTDGIYEKAEEAGDLRTALTAIRESRGNLELLGKLIGELQDSGVTVNIYNNPEWMELRALILNVLEPYSEAKEALADALNRACR